MANFFIQTDQEFYFAGDTVNGNIFINVGTFLNAATGISLKFTGYECVKWVEARELHRPRPNPHRRPNQPPPYDPIAAIPPGQLCQSDNLDISDIESEDDRSYDHRPKFIKTSSNRYFKMSYYETRNMFTKNKSVIYQCAGLQPGQYSFPFSFKTFEGWPASFSHITPKKKGAIIYHMVVEIESPNRQLQLKHAQEITLRETKMLEAQHIKSQAEITSCCCLSKGNTLTEVHFEKDGYMPGQLVQMIIQIDNTYCDVDVTTISITVTNVVTMRSSGSSTCDNYTLFRKGINGVAAGQTAKGNNAIRESFILESTQELKPSCSGKLLSSQFSLNVNMNHDISCDCCSDHVGASIPIIIFPVIHSYQMPNVFQQNWAPQQMPMTNMALSNNFANYQLGQMGGGYPQQGYPQQPYPQQGYPPGPQSMPPPQYQQQQYYQQEMMVQNDPHEETHQEIEG